MTREEAQSEIWNNKTLSTLQKVTCDDLIKKLFDQQEQLQATIKAQEIIIKDKSAIMEAMAQPKTCEGCRYESSDNNCYRFNDCIRDNTRYKHYDRYEPKAQQ